MNLRAATVQPATYVSSKSRTLSKPASPPVARSLSISRGASFWIQRSPGCACGGSCPSCKHQEEDIQIQTKLKIGAPNDKYEQEAERVADRVMRMPESNTESTTWASRSNPSITPLAQRQAEKRESLDAPSDMSSRITALQGRGKPLPASIRNFFEPRFGHNFSDVRVHTDGQASELATRLHAKAFTLGSNVVFGSEQYSPETATGKRLLAHELTHTIQQGKLIDRGFSSFSGSPRSKQERETDNSASGEAYVIQSSVSMSAPLLLQRVCGPTAISALASGCIGRGGDITDFGGSSENIYFFTVNCDDFQSGEEARMRRFASSITLGDTVEIDGFASEEGPASYNEDLSCARANKALSIITSVGVSRTQIIGLWKHGATPGLRPDRRSVVITVHRPEAEPEVAPTPAPPSPTYVACYDGTNVYVNKNGRLHHCAAITGTIGGPTPDGDYCIREQGAAQLGRSLLHPFRSHSDWYLLEPQFPTTRFRMHLHPGSASAGCITVTDTNCFSTLASILNSSGRITLPGYDGYPPGNSEGVSNPNLPKTCVGLLLVSRRTGGCNIMSGATGSP